MVKLELTAILYSNKNYDLAYRLNRYCYKMSMNLVNCINFVELTIKAFQLKPQLIFCDLTSVDISVSQLKVLLENRSCKNTKLVFVGYESHKEIYSCFGLENTDFVCYENLEKYILSCFDVINMNSILVENSKNTDLNESVVQLLYSLGFSPKHTGFKFLKEIIYNIVNNSGVFSSLIGDQYPLIAVKFKTSCYNIERDIRNAITCAFGANGQNWKKTFFDCHYLNDTKRPTNREFICMCVDRLSNIEPQGQFAF